MKKTHTREFIPYESKLSMVFKLKKNSRRNTKNFRTGFTLVEILVVIAILTILAGVISVSIKGAKEKAENISRQVIIEQYRDAVSFYRLENGGFPHQPIGKASTQCNPPSGKKPGYCPDVCLADSPGKKCEGSSDAGTQSIPQDPTINSILSRWVLIQPPFKNVDGVGTGKGTAAKGFKAEFFGPIYRCSWIVGDRCTDASFLWYLVGTDAECSFGEKSPSLKIDYAGVTSCYYKFSI